MQQETRGPVNNGNEVHPLVRGFMSWVGMVSAVIIVLSTSYALWQVKQYAPIVGYILLICLGIMPTIGVVFVAVWLLRFIFKNEVIEIGPYGNILKWFNKTTFIHPRGIQEYKSQTREKKQDDFEVPSLVSLLKSGVLGSMDVLLGFHKDATQRWDTWESLSTFVVAGKSRSGKTVTMVFYIIQALLAGYKVYVCDLQGNANTGDSLLRVIEPLKPFIKFASKKTDMINLIVDFRNENVLKENGDTEDTTKTLLVIDEWTRFLRILSVEEQEIVVNTVLDAGEAWAKFGGYALIGGHEWTAHESGGKKGAAIRRAFHAAAVHRISPDYAKFLLEGREGKKVADTTQKQKTGWLWLQDREGELDFLGIPFYGQQREAIFETADILAVQQPPKYTGEIYEGYDAGYIGTPSTQPVNSVNGEVNRKQGCLQPVNQPLEPLRKVTQPVYRDTGDFEHETEENPVNSEGVNTSQEEIVKRLLKRGIAVRDIAYVIGMYGRNFEQGKQYIESVRSSINTEK